jgi:hypothetical protein
MRKTGNDSTYKKLAAQWFNEASYLVQRWQTVLCSEIADYMKVKIVIHHSKTTTVFN